MLVLCLFSDDLEVVKQQCAHVAVTLRAHLRARAGRAPMRLRPTRGDPPLRRQHLVGRGVINDTGHVRFRRYAWSVRRRERVTLLMLTALFLLSTAISLALYVPFPPEEWAYARGYLDRFSSAVMTAVVVMLSNLVFEFREWKAARAVIDWTLSP